MNNNKRVTRADVAKYANVSETIVSYVINNNRYVDQSKRERVEEAIRVLNYRPNNVARALKGKQSNQIIFIADQITNEYFSRIVSEMDKFAYEKGYLISLCANRNTQEFVSQVISRQYDGIIISSTSFPEEYVKQFVDANIPLVLFMNRRYNNIPRNVGVIDSGLYSGARDCVKYLASKDRKHILYLDRISSKGTMSTMDDLRLSGFVDEMIESGLEFTNDRIIAGCCTEDQVEAEIIKRMNNGLKVDGIFGRNDMLACVALSAVSKLNLKVPEDISVIGFDNSSISRFCSPKLTTMEMQREEISKATIDMLQMIIDGKDGNLKASFKTNLIRRESTGYN
ncbi:substrate-binding domain-containing protein [Anaerocolumna sedimenticola]|uniref:Substrate-binding domain-containing protein n=1 Tax=Anaerocolumna sedimenticola TaxID=2696063 RepID=A0A6P1TE33_9FIRM|nr:LacI family DNA-binding transcriptional regulator [Anaerocolumna sedimenticola]QHQ59490.1 substrate-binding domain-containing protein [Anaerocolumna sedimenticola]